MKHKVLLLFIILLASILRLYKLGEMPPSLANDEAGYIYSAYSIWKTGHDVSGRFLPLSINLDNSFSPVYIYATAPFVGLLGLSPFSGRLPFALIGIVTVYIVYLLAGRLLNKKIALLSSLIMAISPWHLHISKTAFDATFALFFYLWGIFVFIKNIGRTKILYSLIPFFACFLQLSRDKSVFCLFDASFVLYL